MSLCLVDTENIEYFNRLTARISGPMRIWLGPQLYVIIHDAVNAEIVLKSRHCLDKPSVYDIVRDGIGGDGLFTMKSVYTWSSSISLALSLPLEHIIFTIAAWIFVEYTFYRIYFQPISGEFIGVWWAHRWKRHRLLVMCHCSIDISSVLLVIWPKWVKSHSIFCCRCRMPDFPSSWMPFSGWITNFMLRFRKIFPSKFFLYIYHI